MKLSRHFVLGGVAVMTVLGVWSAVNHWKREALVEAGGAASRPITDDEDSKRSSASLLAEALKRSSPAESLASRKAGRVAPPRPMQNSPVTWSTDWSQLPMQDPTARAALAWVGADPEAEEYWFAAINDPLLSADERKDLIEDLNEDGLSDVRYPTLEDLPLIERRLELIEAVAVAPLDEVNAEAFEEAYKDLVNLAAAATGSGEPVK